jgi:hypothetical protein
VYGSQSGTESVMSTLITPLNGLLIENTRFDPRHDARSRGRRYHRANPHLTTATPL